MNESERRPDDAPFPEDEEQAQGTPEEAGDVEAEVVEPAAEEVESPVEAMGERVETGVQAAAEAVEQAEAAAQEFVAEEAEALAETADEAEGVAEAVDEAASEAVTEAETLAEAAIEAEPQAPEPAAAEERTTTVMDRLAEDSEYDAGATGDDKLMAALAYGSQLLVPILVPLILLVSETSRKRPFQKYHAVQSLALGIALWILMSALGVFSAIAAATFIGLLCLCFLVPIMILLWLLPLYYAVLAYSGQRFTIPGLTQFLRDQNWL